MDTVAMRPNPANAAPWVNGTIYRAGIYGFASVASGDVHALEDLGWVSLTVRMMAPPGGALHTPSVTVGTNGYNVLPDGTIWADPEDVVHLQSMGFKAISPDFSAVAA